MYIAATAFESAYEERLVCWTVEAVLEFPVNEKALLNNKNTSHSSPMPTRMKRIVRITLIFYLLTILTIAQLLIFCNILFSQLHDFWHVDLDNCYL